MQPTVKIGRKRYGALGYEYKVTVTYPDCTYETSFAQLNYGGSTFAGGYRIDPSVVERCGGKLTPSFIRKFYADNN